MVRAASPVMMGVTEAASKCLEEECSLETVDDLLKELESEAFRLKAAGGSNEQVQTLLMLGRLQALNEQPDVNKSGIEKLVSAISRTFTTTDSYSFPGEPLGYTMDKNKKKVGLD